MTPSTRITGARVLLDDGLHDTTLTFQDGVITELGGGPADVEIEAAGQMLAPALVDLHGDAFERQIMPRPGVFFPLEGAILETDRQLAANGIATAYHALSLSWEPGLRSVEEGTKFIRGLAALAPRLTVENRAQLRWETFCFEALPLIEEALAGPLMPSIAFNDHTSMSLLTPDIPLQERPFDFAPEYPTADLDGAAFQKKNEGRARRSGLTPEAYVAQIKDIWARRSEVRGVVDRVAAMARAVGAPMLSHDDSQLETRDHYRSIGAATAEFPMRVPVAEAARAQGDKILFGAPNAMRGGSHLTTSPGAGDMVEAGLCDILASDYYYPAMLGAVARLDREGRAALPDLWSLVSGGPAAAMGLADRGHLAPGLRADLVLVDWPQDAAPAVTGTWVAGRCAYRGRPAASLD